MAWIVLCAAGLLEIVWASAIKHSDGFSRFWPSVVGIGAAAASFVMLAAALRRLPVGTAYAVWVGIGAVGVAAVGIVIHGEQTSLVRFGFLGLILVGVIGLRAIEA